MSSRDPPFRGRPAAPIRCGRRACDRVARAWRAGWCAGWVAIGLAVATPAQAEETGRFRREFSANYAADGWWNTDGGLDRGAALLDALQLGGYVERGPAGRSGWLRGFASLLYTNAATFSDRYTGDAMVVSNVDAGHELLVYEAWVEGHFGAGRPASLRAGLYDVASEFDAGEARALFLNSAYGTGHEFAQTGAHGPSVYPVTGLAARLAWAPSERWRAMLAVVDGDPDAARRGRLHLSQQEGALWIGELSAVLPPARLSIGQWGYTAAFPDLRAVTAAGEAVPRHDNAGTYASVEFQPADRTGAARPWRGFLRAGLANGRINAFDRHYSAGLVLDSRWPGPRGSQWGLAVASSRASTAYRRLQDGAGVATDAHERNVELTWRLPLGAHAAIQPSVQYVAQPGAERRLDDALAVGARVEIFVSR